VVRGGFSIIYTMFNPAQFLQSSPNNFPGGALSNVPTGACKTAVPAGTPCPATYGGTIDLAQAQFNGGLNWNGAGGAPVFPQGAVFACTASKPCPIESVDRNYTPPYIYNYNLGVQHAFSNNLSLDVGYVGTHGANLTNWNSINQCAPNTTGDCVGAYTAKFPYLGFIDQTQNNGRSNYNSLQTTLTKRLSHGLNFTAGYTYAHGLDNGSLSRFGNLPQNSLNPGAEYASGDYDVRHRATITATYALPGKKGFGQLLEGWKLNSIVNLQSGQPWYVNDTSYDFSGSGDTADRWNFYGNPSDFTSGSSSFPSCQGFGVTPQGGFDTSGVTCTSRSGVSGIITTYPKSLAAKCTAVAPDPTTLAVGGCFVKGNSVMVPPKAGTFGTMGRNIFRDQGFKNVDFSVFKDFKFKERYGAQFRAEFFNVFNHPTVANPYGAASGFGGGTDPSGATTFGCGCGTPDVLAGNPLVGSGSSRVMQLGLKLSF